MQILRRALLILVPASALLVSSLGAQAVTTAALYGTVTGGDSIPIAEAVVSVTNRATGERWQTTSNARGGFDFEYLSLGGPYTLSARAIGYAPASLADIMLSLGQRRRADFRLEPLVVELTEIIVVSTADPRINAGRTGPAQTFGDSLISRLPLGKRDFTQLAFLSPQAVPGPLGGVSIAGQSDRLNGVQIDGQTNLDLTGFAGGGGGLGTPGAQAGVRTLSVEAIRELQILTAPFDVRYGTFAGGLVNAVTRSGSNRWEGSLSAYFEDQSLTGKDFTGNRAQDFSTKELALTLGGPIVRDRAAFFLDLGLQRDLIPQSVPGIGSDTAGGADSAGVGIRYASVQRFRQILADSFGVDAGDFKAAPSRRPSGNVFAKITLQPGVNQRLEVSHNLAQGNPDSTGDRTPYGQYALTSNGFRAPSTINATRATWAMSPGSGISNELSLSYLRVRERARTPGHFSEVFVAADEGVLAAGDTPAGTVNFSNQDIWELTDNLTVVRGSHQFLLGTHAELIRTKRSTLLLPLGHWEFDSLGALEAGLPAAYFRTLPNPIQGDRPANLGVNQVGFYLQDRWAPTSRLTLTGGIRADVPFITSRPVQNPLLQSELGIDNSSTPTGNLLWSPRIGMSYDLGERGFLRGGVGLFTGRPAYHWLESVYSFNGLEATQLFCGGPDVPAFTLDPASQPTTCASGTFTPTTEANYFDPAFRFPRNLRVAVGADLRLPDDWVGTLDLLYIRGVNQYYATDVNLQTPTALAGEGGRALYGSIDSTGVATPNRRSTAFGPVIEVRNASGDRSYVATVQLQKHFSNGVDLQAAYTYTNTKDRISAAGDLASDNIAELNILDGTLDNRRLATSKYSVPHKITLVGALDLPFHFRFSLFYNGLSGSPYTFRVEGDPNADGLTSNLNPQFNDPVYVPLDSTDITLDSAAQWSSLDRYIKGHSCLRNQRGHLLRRNSCRNPWVTLLNARISKVFPTTRGQSIELMADLFNVLNFLDGDWGVRRGVFGTAILGMVGFDQVNQRGIYQYQSRGTHRRDVEATRWRMQLGARYLF